MYICIHKQKKEQNLYSLPAAVMHVPHHYTYIHKHTHTYINTHTHTHTHIHTHTYIHTHTHTHKHIYIHTHTHKQHTHRNDNTHENTISEENTKNKKKNEKMHSLAEAVDAHAPLLHIQEVDGAGRGLMVKSRDGVCAGQTVLVDMPLAAILHR